MNANQTARSRSTGLWMAENAELVTGKVLDVGCGSKPYHRLCPDNDWVGLDIRPVGDIVADMHDIPSDDESFDTVLCTDALQFSLDPMKAMREMWRVLKPGGWLIIITPHTMPTETGCIGITGEGLSALAGQVTGQQVPAHCGSGLFKTEFQPFRSRCKTAGGFPSEIQGFVDQMDAKYPVVSIVSVRKD